MSNSMGTQSASVCRTGYEIHSCLKIGATKISCVLDKGYNSFPISIPLKSHINHAKILLKSLKNR